MARRHERSRGQGEEYVRDRLAHPPLSGSLNKTMTSPRAHAGTRDTKRDRCAHWDPMAPLKGRKSGAAWMNLETLCSGKSASLRRTDSVGFRYRGHGEAWDPQTQEQEGGGGGRGR